VIGGVSPGCVRASDLEMVRRPGGILCSQCAPAKAPVH
jgi:hypothetical protein